MRYLAVAEMPRRNLMASIRNRGHWSPIWHAVADTSPKPIKTLCGQSYTSEAHRTWDQTMSPSRCPHCERRLVLASDGSRGPTFIAEPSKAPRRA
jgi:hypothetical protein